MSLWLEGDDVVPSYCLVVVGVMLLVVVAVVMVVMVMVMIVVIVVMVTVVVTVVVVVVMMMMPFVESVILPHHYTTHNLIFSPHAPPPHRIIKALGHGPHCVAIESIRPCSHLQSCHRILIVH